MKNKKEAVKTTSFFGAEGGIRTHAPFRTNGFQDRLVMTASIPLHMSVVCDFIIISYLV